VFVGIVLTIDDRNPRQGNVIFSVEEAFKGLAAGASEVEVWPGTGTSCQTAYEGGSRYLIFGNRAGEKSSIVASGGVAAPASWITPAKISSISDPG
jgi:hypothetical protein